MVYRSITSILALCFLCIVTAGAHAQIVQTEVRVSGKIAPLQSWWSQIWSYLGIRSNRHIRPEIGTTLHVVSSAYAPSPYQTDGTPCITASGTIARPGVVATNFLPLGTIIAIDGKKYIVEDRMNSRYDGYYLDIWFPSTSEALEFGRKKLEITIIDYGEPGDILEKPSPTPKQEKTIWRSIGDSVNAIGHFLVTRTYSDVNRYDVDCTI